MNLLKLVNWIENCIKTEEIHVTSERDTLHVYVKNNSGAGDVSIDHQLCTMSYIPTLWRPQSYATR